MPGGLAWQLYHTNFRVQRPEKKDCGKYFYSPGIFFLLSIGKRPQRTGYGDIIRLTVEKHPGGFGLF